MQINKFYHGRMEIILKDFPNNYFDSIVTDPPYGISFMGNHWDYDVPSVDQWEEAFRVLKPGGFILSFGGTRTYHRMVVNIEDAGFEIKDQIQWIYGQGFPKSMDISKSINKTHGTVKEGTEQWGGWGTALKPANEPICMARKPIEGTITATVLKWGTGAINIDGSRIATDEEIKNNSRSSNDSKSKGKYGDSKEQEIHQTDGQKAGRFPSNVIMDEYCGKLLDKQTGVLKSGAIAPNNTAKKIRMYLANIIKYVLIFLNLIKVEQADSFIALNLILQRKIKG